MWHSREYVCLSRIKLVLRVIKEIFHAFVQWTVFQTEMNNKWTEMYRSEPTYGQRRLYMLFTFHYIQVVIIIAIYLVSVLDLFYGDVEFLPSCYLGLCMICNDYTLSHAAFSV